MSDDPRFTRSREAILRAVVEILEAEGPAAVTHQHVAERAGVGRATVYRHWPKQVDLLLAAIERADLPFLEPAEGPLRERLHVDLRRLGENLAAPAMPSMIATLIDRAQREASFRERNQRLVTRAVGNMQAALERAVERGELDRAPDPQLLVSQLLGAVLFRRLIADQPITDDFIDQLTATALAPAVAAATSRTPHPDSTDEQPPTRDPMTTNIAIITLRDPHTADDAYTAAHTLHGVTGAVVVARDQNGRIEVTRSTNPPQDETLKGGVLGALIGILGGPLGILLGWTTGALVGQTTDNTAYDDAVDAIAFLSDRITPGTSAVMVEIDENDPAVLNAALAHFDTPILRIPIDEVAAEVAEARDQINEAAKTARNARRESHRAALHDRRTAFHTRIREFFDQPDKPADEPFSTS